MALSRVCGDCRNVLAFAEPMRERACETDRFRAIGTEAKRLLATSTIWVQLRSIRPTIWTSSRGRARMAYAILSGTLL
jgi:hypothetical protein